MDLTLLALAKGYTDKQIEKAEMGGFQLDPSLTKEGFAADAKAVGEAISKTVGAPGPEGPQGPQGEPGTSGVHVGTEPPTDDTANVWVNIDENASVPDFIQSPDTAEVGQTIVVKSVDETGKPTQWEAVDMASGGNSEYKFINQITLDEDTQVVAISTDANGNAFSYQNVFIRGETTAADGTTTNLKVCFSRDKYSGDANFDTAGYGFVKNDGCSWILDVQTVAGCHLVYSAGNNSGVNGLNTSVTYGRNQSDRGYYDVHSVIFGTDSGGGFKAGSNFEIWGR